MAGKIGFEEYVDVLNRLSHKDLNSGLYLPGDNIQINIDTSPKNVKDGLIRSHKFELRNWPQDQGKYQLEHLTTGAHILVKYEGIFEDYSKGWRTPEPNEGYITIHPEGFKPRRGDSLGKRVLPDILEFAKAEQIRLNALWRMANQDKSDSEYYRVTYEPRSRK